MVVLLHDWWPLLAGGPVVTIAAFSPAARAVPTDTTTTLVVLIAAATMVAAGTFGLLCTRALNPLAAVPVAALVPYAWLVVPTLGDHVLLRNMNSSLLGCCSTGQELSPGLVGGNLAFLGPSRPPRRRRPRWDRSLCWGCGDSAVMWWARTRGMGLLVGVLLCVLAAAHVIGGRSAQVPTVFGGGGAPVLATSVLPICWPTSCGSCRWTAIPDGVSASPP